MEGLDPDFRRAVINLAIMGVKGVEKKSKTKKKVDEEIKNRAKHVLSKATVNLCRNIT